MESQYIYKHLRYKSEGLEATIVIKQEDKEHYLVGWAHCSPQDNYCKQTGRELAVERLKAEPIMLTRAILAAPFSSGNAVITDEAGVNVANFIQIEDYKFNYVLEIATNLVLKQFHK